MTRVWTTSQSLEYFKRSSNSAPWGDPLYFTLNSSVTMDGGNWYPLNPSSDTGGPWQLVRSLQEITASAWFDPVGISKLFTGNGTCSVPGTNILADIVAESDSSLNSFGTTAIARSSPVNPAFSMATALGELANDGLPSVVGASLVKERVKLARASGGEYLNVQFGWLPLVRDLMSFAKTVKESHKILHQYRKDSDQKIRRGYQFPLSEDNVLGTYFAVRVPTGGTSQSGTGHIRESRRVNTWFKGAFRYHIPTGDDLLSRFDRYYSQAEHLLGITPTPEVLWNLAPWSWAVDWFTDTGDVMTNISNLGKDGLVMQYGYVMAHRVIERNFTATIAGKQVGRRTVTETKQRRKATPYGFGVNSSSLSPRQVAIIAALGLSRT